MLLRYDCPAFDIPWAKAKSWPPKHAIGPEHVSVYSGFATPVHVNESNLSWSCSLVIIIAQHDIALLKIAMHIHPGQGTIYWQVLMGLPIIIPEIISITPDVSST